MISAATKKQISSQMTSVLPVSAQMPSSTATVVTAMVVDAMQRRMIVAYEDGRISLLPYPALDRDDEKFLLQVSTFISRMALSADRKMLIMIEAGTRSIIQAKMPQLKS